MASDNTLGAPTEGLGQTVTFAIGSAGGVPQQQPVPRSNLRVQAQGGQAQRTSQALMVQEARPDPTFTALMKLGGDILKPHVERERNVMFMQGVQKAASEQAITEIVDEQPWYSQLFGPTSLVDGARAYTASKKATDFAIDVETNIKQYRAMPEKEFTRVMADRMSSMMTGDPATDALATQQIAQQMPGVFKGVAKERVRYAQETFTNERTAALRSKLDQIGVVDASARNPERAAEGVDAVETMSQAMQLLVTPEGVDKKLDDGIVGGAVMEALSKGNFAAYTWLADSKKLAELEPEMAYRVNRAYEQAQREARTKLPPEFAGIIANYKHMAAEPGTTEEQITQAAEAANAQYTKATGDPTPLITVSSLTGEFLQLKQVTASREAQAARQAATATAKLSKEEAKADALNQLASNMVAAERFTPVGLSKEDIQDGFNELHRRGNPNAVITAVANMWPHRAIDKVLADRIRSTATIGLAGEPSQLDAAYRDWLRVHDSLGGGAIGRAAAAEYAGDTAKQLERYHDYAARRVLDVADIQVAASVAARPTVKDAPKDMVKAVKDSYDSWAPAAAQTMGRFLNWTDAMPVKDPDGLAKLVAGYVDPTGDIAAGVIAAENTLGLSVAGGHYWTTPPKATKFKDWAALPANWQAGGVHSDNMNRAMALAIDTFAAEVGISEGLQITQTADTSTKDPRFIVRGLRSNGQPTHRVFTGSDMNTLWKQQGSGEFFKSKAIKDAQRMEALGSALDAFGSWFTDTSRLPVTKPGEPFGPSAFTK